MTLPIAEAAPASQRFAAIDVETTGLDTKRDEVIEIAVLAFGRNDVEESFTTLVRPRRTISLDIQKLTGIEQRELDASQPFVEHRSRVEELIGDLPIIGHNVDFDCEMLRSAGLSLPNPAYDTYRLSTLLLSDLSSYALSSIAEALEIPTGGVHRALLDATTAARLFQHLLSRIEQYDVETLNRVARFAQIAGWPEAALFRDARERKEQAPRSISIEDTRDIPLDIQLSTTRERPDALQKTGSGRTLNTKAIEHLLSDEGPLPHVIERYESRPSQTRMAVAVARALNDEHELLVEAGTGTGKSLAYLLPAALFAIERGERVVVSTDTLGLQDQLYRKDLPDIRTMLAEHGVEEELRVAVMKGRTNYLCLRRWFEHAEDPIEDPADASLRAKISLWLPYTETGDRAELRLTREEERHWRKFCSEKGRCTPKRCPYARANQCFLYRARHLAANAHIVIANHSLVLSNSAQGYVLPDFQRLVIDEAHHLEDEATDQFGWTVDRSAIEEPIRALIVPDGSGPVGHFTNAVTFLRRLLEMTAVNETRVASEHAQEAMQQSGTLSALIGELFERVNSLMPKPRWGGNQGFADRLRLTDAVRLRDAWSECALIWGQVDRGVEQILDAGRWYLQTLDALDLPDDDEHPDTQYRDELMIEMQHVLEDLQAVRRHLLNAFGRESDDEVVWIQRSAQLSHLSLNGAPLSVSTLLRQSVFAGMRSVALTSATLTVDGSFGYIQEILGLEEAIAMPLGSPFDHRKTTLICAPNDIPDPRNDRYQATLNETLMETLTATRGRALVLFTSYRSLRETRAAIKGPLERQGIVVLGQGEDGSMRQLVERLRSSPGTVLLGTSSFWEGIDVAGEALSMVVITKLPFPVPSDPVFEARSELYTDAFLDLSVPQAVLKFKQGFGRLIRRSSDRGVCVILDQRVVTKRYGQSFVQSLPTARVKVGSVYDVPTEASRWLDTDLS